MKKLFIAAILTVLGTEAVAFEVYIDYCIKASGSSLEIADCLIRERKIYKAQKEAKAREELLALKRPLLTKDGKTIDDDAPGDQWRVSVKTRALTGETNVYIRTMSTNVESDIIGSAKRGKLTVRCHNGDTDLIISYSEYFNREERVEFKIDDGPIFSEEMWPAIGGGSMGIWGDTHALPMIRKILGHAEMNLELPAYSQTVPLTFDVSGLANVIAPLTEACNWKP